jgi:hypothetical protein
VHQPLIQTIVDEQNGMGRCPSTGESAVVPRAVDRMLAIAVKRAFSSDRVLWRHDERN